MTRRRLSLAVTAVVLALAGALAVASPASASTGGELPPLSFLGLPSLQDIVDAIAKGFFGALASALVPDFLKHGSVATIQHLVALPDPARWRHVGQLQDDMVYLGAMLLPVALAVGTLRYWMLGFTGAAHPAGALGRCVGASGVLVAYRWIVEQVVAATNTLTHAILAFPAVGGGLQRIIAVLFGGALLTGSGGVFGAFLVIVGVVFAAGLFAVQVLLTVVMAMLIVAGPPLIALTAIPELSHLARAWAHALLTISLIPLGWTVLFATAGALSLDATSFTGGAGGLPGHIAAAFAGLITFVIAVRLPLMLLGELRHLFGGATLRTRPRPSQPSAGSLPGAERVRAAHARLRSATLQGIPSLGQSVGEAAGALGAPAGGPLGAARRRLAARGAPSRRGERGASSRATARARTNVPARAGEISDRLRSAGVILATAPRRAKSAMGSRASKPPDVAIPAQPRSGPAPPQRLQSASTSTAKARPHVVASMPAQQGDKATGQRTPSAVATSHEHDALTNTPLRRPASRTTEDSRAPQRHGSAQNPGRTVAREAQHNAPAPATRTPAPKTDGQQRSSKRKGRPQAPPPPPPAKRSNPPRQPRRRGKP